jgi:hypothetical protein
MAEFGSWEGASALTFLLAAKKAKLDLALICVDTWLGSREHWENSFPDSQWSFERLKVIEGEPTVIETFRKAIDNQGLSSQVNLVRAPTTHAAGYISRTFPKLDLVFLDADHSFSAVRQDLTLAMGLISDSGLIAGDDWGWPSVQLAVATRSFLRRKIYSSPDGSTYVLLKRHQTAFESKFVTADWSRKSPASVLIRVPMRQLLRLLSKKGKSKVDSLYTLLKRAR